MKKLLKGNNKGFVLVETLIATVFVAAIFSIIYINFFPLMGEYEKRENYDDVDSKYGAFWAKRLVEDSDKFDFGSHHGFLVLGHLCLAKNEFCTTMYNDNNKLNRCNNILTGLKVKQIVLTPYKLSQIKEKIKENDAMVSNLTSEMKEYIKYLPEYDNYHSLYDNDYRVIVEFEKTDKDGLGNEITYNTFSTMEVNK